MADQWLPLPCSNMNTCSSEGILSLMDITLSYSSWLLTAQYLLSLWLRMYS